MSVENNECVVATASNDEAVEKIKAWVMTLSEREQSLFAFVPALANSKTTIFLAPDGSKKGWEAANHGEALRSQLIEMLALFNYEDGSNPFSWVEVGYGEYGQKVLRGNNVNCCSDDEYAV
ncbi:MAG: hypothetical protein ACRBCS_03065 [Cellvibrionaceae bacterium]